MSERAPSANARASLERVPDRLSHIDQAGSARMVDVGEGGDGSARRRAGDRAHVGGYARGGPARRRPEGRRGRHGAHRRHPGSQAHRRSHPALPSAAALLRRRALVDRPRAREHRGRARTSARTGVEMEALTAASVAALTVYDMVKGSSARWRSRGRAAREVGWTTRLAEGGVTEEQRALIRHIYDAMNRRDLDALRHSVQVDPDFEWASAGDELDAVSRRGNGGLDGYTASCSASSTSSHGDRRGDRPGPRPGDLRGAPQLRGAKSGAKAERREDTCGR